MESMRRQTLPLSDCPKNTCNIYYITPRLVSFFGQTAKMAVPDAGNAAWRRALRGLGRPRIADVQSALDAGEQVLVVAWTPGLRAYSPRYASFPSAAIAATAYQSHLDRVQYSSGACCVIHGGWPQFVYVDYEVEGAVGDLPTVANACSRLRARLVERARDLGIEWSGSCRFWDCSRSTATGHKLSLHVVMDLVCADASSVFEFMEPLLSMEGVDSSVYRRVNNKTVLMRLPMATKSWVSSPTISVFRPVPGFFDDMKVAGTSVVMPTQAYASSGPPVQFTGSGSSSIPAPTIPRDAIMQAESDEEPEVKADHAEPDSEDPVLALVSRVTETPLAKLTLAPTLSSHYAVVECPRMCYTCKEVHNSNRAYIYRLENEDSVWYRCLAPAADGDGTLKYVGSTVTYELREECGLYDSDDMEITFVGGDDIKYVSDLDLDFTKRRCQIIDAPCGAGKSRKLAEIAHSCDRTIYLLPRRSSVQSWRSTMEKYVRDVCEDDEPKPSIGCYNESGGPRDHYMTTIQSLYRMLEWWRPNEQGKSLAVIFDESNTLAEFLLDPTTNHGHMRENLDVLELLISQATHVILADGHAYTIGTSILMAKHFFEDSEIQVTVVATTPLPRIHMMYPEQAHADKFLAGMASAARDGSSPTWLASRKRGYVETIWAALSSEGKSEDIPLLLEYSSHTPEDISRDWGPSATPHDGDGGLLVGTSAVSVGHNLTTPVHVAAFMGPASGFAAGGRDMFQLVCRARNAIDGIVEVLYPQPTFHAPRPLAEINEEMRAIRRGIRSAAKGAHYKTSYPVEILATGYSYKAVGVEITMAPSTLVRLAGVLKFLRSWGPSALYAFCAEANGHVVARKLPPPKPKAAPQMESKQARIIGKEEIKAARATMFNSIDQETAKDQLQTIKRRQLSGESLNEDSSGVVDFLIAILLFNVQAQPLQFEVAEFAIKHRAQLRNCCLMGLDDEQLEEVKKAEFLTLSGQLPDINSVNAGTLAVATLTDLVKSIGFTGLDDEKTKILSTEFGSMTDEINEVCSKMCNLRKGRWVAATCARSAVARVRTELRSWFGLSLKAARRKRTREASGDNRRTLYAIAQHEARKLAPMCAFFLRVRGVEKTDLPPPPKELSEL